jgi:anhydro-N-acetylmuramic acid kinase
MLSLNQNLQKLFNIAHKSTKTGIGLMSGTSLDGLDIALCSFMGSGLQTQFKLLQFTTIPYPQRFKDEVQQVFARKTADLEQVTLLNAFIGNYHGELVLEALADWGIDPDTVDFIASHGQTIYHAPKRLHRQANYPNATLQIGDGDHLAVKTGILTISDFRQKHIAAGGEGAPLALYGDVLLGSKAGENRILLNIGGIANLTYLPADGEPAKILCTDIGPGNTLIDAACRKYFNVAYDQDSAIANSGKVNEHIRNEDLVCTLSMFTAVVIETFVKTNIMADNLHIFVSGGGARNPFIMTYLKQAFEDIPIVDTSKLGIDPDAKEAILFALLGNEALCGEPMTIGNNPAVLMGKLSFPG